MASTIPRLQGVDFERYSEAMRYILDRLKEPSTWRGLISLVAIFGIKIAPEQAETIMTAGVSIYSAINILRKEQK